MVFAVRYADGCHSQSKVFDCPLCGNQYFEGQNRRHTRDFGMDIQKLAKVLAMAGSENETEAAHALRTAKRMLTAEGLDFIDLAKAMSGAGDVSASVLQDAIFDLRNEVRQLRAENNRLKQSSGTPASVTAPPPASFQDSAREAANLIRLRSELDAAMEQMAAQKAHEVELRRQINDLVAEADDLRRRLADAESRRMRSDVENRRLLHANHALDVENCELRAALTAKSEPEPAPIPAALPAPSRPPRRTGNAAEPSPDQQYSFL